MHIHKFNKTGLFLLIAMLFSLPVQSSLFDKKKKKKAAPQQAISTALWDQLKNYNPLIEKEIVIIVVSYNNKDWYKKNLDSILMQKYTNYHVIYVDDVSPDGTADLVEAYIKEKKAEKNITLIRNTTRCGGMENTYNAIHLVPDDKIIITLDGDDWFYHENVLSLINKVYQDPHIWLTYGQYIESDDNRVGVCRPLPQDVIINNTFRQHPWVTSHLRSFYAWLFKKIKIEDLKHDGKFFWTTWDQAMMFPMLEMAHNKIMFIPDTLYVHNIGTPLNDYKLYAKQYKKTHKEICSRKAYSPIN